MGDLLQRLRAARDDGRMVDPTEALEAIERMMRGRDVMIRRLLKRGEIEVQPEWFGAVADGKADDHAALQECIDWAARERALRAAVKRAFAGEAP